MRPRLILHFGTHKTGTTAIQKFSEASRSTLLKRGLLYPGYKPVIDEMPYAHHQFAKAVADQGRKIDRVGAQELVSQWVEFAERNQVDVLISAEPMYRLGISFGETGTDWVGQRENYLSRLAEILKPFDVSPVITFRRPDDFIRSLYQENVMLGLSNARQEFEEFRSAHITNFLRYGTNALIIEKFFPRLNVLIYEDLVAEGNLCSAFYESIGFDVSDLSMPTKVRKSLTVPESKVKRFLNNAKLTEKQSNQVVAWIKTTEIQKLIAEYYGERDWDLWNNSEERNEFLEEVSGEVDLLHQKFLWNRKQVFPPVDQEPNGVAAPELSDELKSRLTMEALYGNGVRGLPSSSKVYRK